jgi:NTP pyrophosphatase (non-canonical NTP hydrolase)
MSYEGIFRAAIAKWGLPLQVTVAIEEMAELTHALCRWQRFDNNVPNLENIAEEIADVQIMLEQLIVGLDLNRLAWATKVDNVRAEKMVRLKQRLESLCTNTTEGAKS